MALERILEPEFDLAATRYGQREISEIGTKQCEDLIEPVWGNNVGDVSEEVRVIEGVEKLRAELQLVALVQLEGPRDAGVIKPLSGTDVGVPAKVPVHTGCRNNEVEGRSRLRSACGQTVQACLQWKERSWRCRESELRAIDPHGLKRGRGIPKIGPVVPATAIPIVVKSVADRFRIAGLRRDRAGPTPTPGDVAEHTQGCIFRAVNVGQLPDICPHEAITAVVC